MKEAPNMATVISSFDKITLNSGICRSPEWHHPLPSQWEQCFDLKTGEVYYINWETGEQSVEDPKLKSISKDDDREEKKDSWYESEKSSSTTNDSSPSSATTNSCSNSLHKNQVLVVAGCRNCFMYHMLPKHVKECPKCQNPFLLHFDQPPKGP